MNLQKKAKRLWEPNEAGLSVTQKILTPEPTKYDPAEIDRNEVDFSNDRWADDGGNNLD